MREIKVEMMSPENFKDFGQMIIPTKDKITFSNEFVDHYHDLASLETLGRDPVVTFFSTYRRPFIIDKLERHRNTSEIFFPVGGVALMPFAPDLPDGNPDIEKMRVFTCIPGKPFIGGKGVWHIFPFPLEERYEAYNIVEKEIIENDLEIFELDEPVRIIL